MHRLHEGNIGIYRFLVQGLRIRQQGDRAHRALDGIQQRQAGEDPHGGFFFFFRQRLPAGEIIRDWDLFREPEVTGQPLPYLEVFVIGDGIPVDSFYRAVMTSNVVIVFVRHAMSLQCFTV